MLVSLASPPQTEDAPELAVVVGLCAAVESDRPNSDLKAHGLPTPNWASTVESVQQHYPAGCSVSGVWVKVQQEEVEPTVKLLIEKTKLKVNILKV